MLSKGRLIDLSKKKKKSKKYENDFLHFSFFALQENHLTVRSFSSRKYRTECYLLYFVKIFGELNSVMLSLSCKNNVIINAIIYVENVRNDFVKVLYLTSEERDRVRLQPNG